MNPLAIYYRYRAVVRSLTRRGAVDREMREEMDAHLEQAAARYVARGMSSRDAREAARREFGNVAVLQEEGRDARTGQWLESVLGDLRFAFRQIARRPLASATIVGVLALGIGVHSGVFAIYQALRLRPASGVRPSDALVRLRGKERAPENPSWQPRDFSYPEYRELAARTDLFAKTTAWTMSVVALDLGDPDQASSARINFVADDYFDVAGVRVALGRPLPPDGEMVAVIGDAMWRAAFGGAPDVIGRTVKVNDALVRIDGVAPPQFNGLVMSGTARTMWMPLASRATVLRTTRAALVDRDSALLDGAAMLAPGVAMERASGAAQLVSEQAIRRMTPALDKRIRTTDVVPLLTKFELPEDPETLFVTLGFSLVALLVLLVACTNVSALVVGAGMQRSQEIAIRLSLGASRARIIRQLLTESCVLAVAGGALGLVLYGLFTFIASRSLLGLEINPDLATATFTLVIALATGILFGLSPALHATKSGVAEVMKGGGAAGGATTRTRLQSFFVVAQIAVTQPLLFGVAVILVLVMRQDERGVDQSVAHRVVQMRFDLRKVGPEGHERLRAAMRDIEALPGVERVTADANGRDGIDFAVAAGSRAGLIRETPINVHVEGANPGYLTLLGVPILRGRDLVAADTAAVDLPVLISNDVAHELWGNADPIGRRFSQITHDKTQPRSAVVVGIYDVSHGSPRGSGRRVFAIDNGTWLDFTQIVRTTGPARPMIRTIRDRLRQTLPDIPVVTIATLEEAFAEQQAEVVQVGTGAGVGGALVLLLASIGLYGVIAVAVVQRRREIGIRIALGAKPVEVVALLFRQGIKLGGLGLLIGLPLSIAAVLVIRAGIASGSADPWSIGRELASFSGVIAGTVIVVAAIATWIPARRAAIVDPMIALRID